MPMFPPGSLVYEDGDTVYSFYKSNYNRFLRLMMVYPLRRHRSLNSLRKPEDRIKRAVRAAIIFQKFSARCAYELRTSEIVPELYRGIREKSYKLCTPVGMSVFRRGEGGELVPVPLAACRVPFCPFCWTRRVTGPIVKAAWDMQRAFKDDKRYRMYRISHTEQFTVSGHSAKPLFDMAAKWKSKLSRRLSDKLAHYAFHVQVLPWTKDDLESMNWAVRVLGVAFSPLKLNTLPYLGPAHLPNSRRLAQILRRTVTYPLGILRAEPYPIVRWLQAGHKQRVVCIRPIDD